MKKMICAKCKKTISSNNYYYYDPDEKYYCSEECFRYFLQTKKEEEDRKFLYETIRRIYRVVFPSPRMLGEIKNYKEKLGITYKQQAAILHYVYEVAKKESPWEGLIAIPKYKDETKEYYEAARKRKQDVDNFIENQPEQKVIMMSDQTSKNKVRELSEAQF